MAARGAGAAARSDAADRRDGHSCRDRPDGKGLHGRISGGASGTRFGGGVAAAAWSLALSYFTNYCYIGEEGSKIRTWKHPYIEDGKNTPTWRCWAYAFHVGAIVWGVLALAAFLVGMFDVRNAIVRLGN